MRNEKPRIIFVTNCIPLSNRSSGELRTFNILQFLSKQWDIDLCAIQQQGNEDKLDENVNLYCNKFKALSINVLPLEYNSFTKAILKNKYDGAYFNLYWVAEKVINSFKRLQSSAFTIIDSVDLHYSRLETSLQYNLIGYHKLWYMRYCEIKTYKKADCVIVVSEEDRIRLQQDSKLSTLELVPNIYDTVFRPDNVREPIVIFIGSFTWYPNPDAVKWFVKEVWPKVIESIPSAKFVIVGGNPTKEILNLHGKQNISVEGFVKETKEFIDKSSVSVAPLRIGGGMKGKVNEALAHGIPVVSTTIGAQGFNAINGQDMFIADDPNEFSDYIIQLLKDPKLQESIGLSGQFLNHKICSSERVNQTLLKISTFPKKNQVHKISGISDRFKTRLYYLYYCSKVMPVTDLSRLRNFLIKMKHHSIFATNLLINDGVFIFTKKLVLYILRKLNNNDKEHRES